MTLTHQDAVVTWHEPVPVPLRGTLVVVPGRGESPDVYERFGRRLAADAYRVHVVTAPTGDVADADQAHEQLAGVLETADAATPRIVVGSDAGASYVAYLAGQSLLSDASALVLAGLPTTSASVPAKDWDGELDVRTACSTHRARISQAGVRQTELFSELPSEWLGPQTPTRIALPVLGLHGRDDLLSPVESARQWYSAVPHAELVTIAGGRHDALNDQTHRSVAATIVLFLERLRLGADLAPIAILEDLRAKVSNAS